MRLGLATSLALVALLPIAASAQALGSSLSTDNMFSISVSPQYPTPYGQATLSFLSSFIDLTNATMTVSSGGKQIYKGGVQDVPVTLGKVGSVANISAAVSSGGATYTQSVIIQPEDVTLVAEPISSAPALYPGNPLVPLGGDTRVVAIANFADASGRTIDPSTLSYDWTVDGADIASASGIGKESVMVASPLQYRTRSVSVVVQSPSGSLVGGASLTLAPAEPTVRIYESDPLLGILFDHALSGSYAISGTEETLYAAPFSFPLIVGSPSLEWSLNGSVAQEGSTITLRPSGSGQGDASLSVTGSSADATLQALATLSLSFGTPSTNPFGL